MGNNGKIFFILILFIAFFASLAVNAQENSEGNPEVYFKTTAGSFQPGSTVDVGVFITSPAQVNAYDLDIAYSPGTLEFVDFDITNSIVDFWRRDPEVYKEGRIEAQGGSSQPFEGRAGEIMKLSFKVKDQEGLAQWSFRRARVFKADGLGTELTVDRGHLTLPISEMAGSSLEQGEVPEDTTPPEIRDLQIVKNPVDDSSLLTFMAIDKESGVEGSFVRYKRWLTWGGWETITPPVKVPDGVWAVQVEAIDKAKNSTVESLAAPRQKTRKTIYLILFIITVIISAYVFFKKIR